MHRQATDIRAMPRSEEAELVAAVLHLAESANRHAGFTDMRIELPAELHCERDAWVASCPQLHVASQGATVEEAMAMLREALALFIEGCREEGILDRVLQESGLEVKIEANADVR